MRARIYKPSKTAMSSGLAKTKSWVLEFIQETTSEIDPLMGWTSSGDTQSKFNIRSGGYGENFATNRRGAWTH
jgi:NADH dehydrogenase